MAPKESFGLTLPKENLSSRCTGRFPQIRRGVLVKCKNLQVVCAMCRFLRISIYWAQKSKKEKMCLHGLLSHVQFQRITGIRSIRACVETDSVEQLHYWLRYNCSANVCRVLRLCVGDKLYKLDKSSRTLSPPMKRLLDSHDIRLHTRPPRQTLKQNASCVSSHWHNSNSEFTLLTLFVYLSFCCPHLQQTFDSVATDCKDCKSADCESVASDCESVAIDCD